MAYRLFAENGKPAYGVKNYILDTAADIADLSIASTPGSTAYVADSGITYVLNNKEEWVQMPIASSGGGSVSPNPGSVDQYVPISPSEIDSFFEEDN